VDIIVATIAFGMGIDKPDVRLIIHHTFSKTLEGYYQEIGRAGRDGFSSDCVLFYSWGDKRKHEFFIKQIMDEFAQKKSMDQLRKIMDYCEYTSCRRKYILRYFGENFQEDNCKGCDICLNLQEIKGEGDKKLFFEKVKENISYDKSLFEELRVLRKQIANEKNFPAFVIFGDVSLREMASYFPKNNEEFLRIKGVGEQKLNDYGELFLEAINNYVKENDIDAMGIPRKEKKKSKTRFLSKNYQKTKEMILKKISIEEIAGIHGFKERRIIYHIEKLLEGGENIDINYLIPSKERFESIKSAFEEFGTKLLAPIYNYFNGEFSYDEIRLVRMAIKLKNEDVEKDDKENNSKIDYHQRLEEIKEEFPNAYESWDEDEDNKLKRLFSKNVPIQALTKIFKRQPSAIRSRLRKFGVL
ncbi:MAG TPA: RecQ family ATP-dependent DNA helicase, partial [Candidatus Pacearchaeota archaeon]|nr:RecQ family ATP-dependent DNA helicase [Candidatus Pacearchaeota archaeon]